MGTQRNFGDEQDFKSALSSIRKQAIVHVVKGKPSGDMVVELVLEGTDYQFSQTQVVHLFRDDGLTPAGMEAFASSLPR